MTTEGNGGFIGINAPITSNGGSGIWSIDDAYLLTLSSQWPKRNHNISGGTITEITTGGVNYKVHTFTAPGTLTVSTVGYAAPTELEYLVVAGGGGAYVAFDAYGVYASGSGGGGAGGLKQGSGPTALVIQAGTYPVTVGAGGAGSSPGSVGNPSTLSWSPAPITTTGGGNGGAPDTSPPFGPAAGGPGGSGGGGGAVGPPTSASITGGSGVPGEGFPGGNGGSPGPGFTGAGGGGGAGGAGYIGGPPGSITPGFQGYGGAGVASTISNTSVTYAAGGGGYAAPAASTPTTAGSGGGSGPAAPYSGRDGIVIVRYKVV